jgi:hypothetical protein
VKNNAAPFIKVFIGDTAEKHSTESAVAYRKGFDPLLCGLFVPESERGIEGEGGLAQNDWK